MISEKIPKICVLLSAYNGEQYIVEQINSIFNQKNVEVFCIVRNDGSTDNTYIMLQELGKKHENLRILKGENIGFAKSFYKLLELSDDFEYYAFADQDDLWFDDKLASCVNLLKTDNAGLCFCNGYITDEKLNIRGKLFDNYLQPDNKYFALLKNPCPGCSMIFNKKAKNMFLRADENKIMYHDFWMFVVCSMFGEVFCENEPKFYYRQHGSNTLGSDAEFNYVIRN